MGIIDSIKKSATKNGTKIQTSEATILEKILNRMFYLEKNKEEEVAFIRQMITRGQETQERVGLHASALIVADTSFCVRQQVLSLLYHQIQGENVEIGLKRIFEEGNAIHEKWQRLFLRAGYGKHTDMDFTRFCDKYEVSFTPDAIVTIPEFNKEVGWDGPMICEIKSVNTFQFKHMTSHSTGMKQMQFYMYLTGIHKGFVLCDDKNTQDFKIFIYDYDKSIVAPFIERCEAIQYYKKRVLEDNKMVKRCKGCNKPDCKKASGCPLRDACYNVGMGRQLIDKYKKYKKN